MSTEKINIKQLVEEYKSLTAREAVDFKLQANPPERLTASKVGGCPYWDLSQPLPTDAESKTMYLLAQINFEDYPFPAPLPKAGLLQIFISSKDYFAHDVPTTKQKDFRVVYHIKLDDNITEEQVVGAGYEYYEEGGETFPIYSPKGHSVILAPHLCYPNSDEGGTQIKELVDKYNLDGKQEQKLIEQIEYLAYDANAASHLLGFPIFAQEDPRVYKDSLRKYDTLLFQLDSDSTEFDEGNWAVIWGDAGVGNFFIPREKLEALDFTDVLYNWDCS